MLKSYSHNNLKKGRCVEATKRPFLSLIDSRDPVRSVSGSGWAWTDADHLELNGYVKLKTNTTTKTTVTKTSRPKAATATTATLPKTGDSNWIAASVTLFLLGTVFLAVAYRCQDPVYARPGEG